MFDSSTPFPTIIGSIIFAIIGVLLEIVRRRGGQVKETGSDAGMNQAAQNVSDFLMGELRKQLEESEKDIKAARRQATSAFSEMTSARDEARRAQSEMEEMRTRWKIERTASDDYIRELVDHIINELPPPPPEAPAVLSHLFRDTR